MLKHKKFKIHFEVLYNWEKWLLRMNRTHHNPSKFTQIAGIISGKLDLLFIDDQIQRFREYFHTIMIKSLVGIVLFSTLFAKKGQDISGTRRCIVSLGFSNSKNKSLPFINQERSAEKSISEYFLRIFAKRAVH